MPIKFKFYIIWPLRYFAAPPGAGQLDFAGGLTDLTRIGLNYSHQSSSIMTTEFIFYINSDSISIRFCQGVDRFRKDRLKLKICLIKLCCTLYPTIPLCPCFPVSLYSCFLYIHVSLCVPVSIYYCIILFFFIPVSLYYCITVTLISLYPVFLYPCTSLTYYNM